MELDLNDHSLCQQNVFFRQGYLKRVIALFHLREYFIQKIVG